MWSTSMTAPPTCIMKVVSDFYNESGLYKYNKFLHFHMISAALLLITLFFFLKLIISIACSLNDLQYVFMESLFSILLNDNTVNTEKPDGICLPTSIVDEF